MKRIIGLLSFILLFSVSVGAQKYVPFPTENAEWNVHFKNWSSIGGLSSYIDEYKQDGDTVINGKTYRKVYIKSPGTNNLSYYRGGIREENKRIYWLDNTNTRYFGMGIYLSSGQKDCMKQYLTTNTNEVVLYDFNKTNIGDTLITKIIAIDSVKIQNTYRKRYTILPYRQTIGWKYTYDYVIEGIGSVRNGLLAVTIPLTTCMEPPMWEFVSFKQDNQVVYKNPAYKNPNDIARWDDIDFLKTGAQWYYGHTNYLSSDYNPKYSFKDYIMYKSMGDTLFDGKTCRKLEVTRGGNSIYAYVTKMIVYQSNDSLFFKRNNDQKFSLLNVYGAKKGDSWITNYYSGNVVKVMVDSVSQTMVAGNALNQLHVRYTNAEHPDEWNNGGPKSLLIEGIGDTTVFFYSSRYLSLADDLYDNADGLRCYVHPDLGTYHVPGTLDCTYVTEVPRQNYSTLKVNLNSSGILSIDGDLSTESCTFELLDLKGSVMLKTTLKASQNTVNLSQYDKGLYLYRISANGVLLKAGKIVKN